jgi:hypothetical protein
MKLPELSSDQKIQDRVAVFPNGLRGGGVGVSNVLGEVRGVSYAQVPDDERALLSDPATAQDTLKSIFHEDTLIQILAASPNTTLMHESGLTLADGSPAWLAVLLVPQGSSMVKRPNDFQPDGVRLDAKRAFLLMFHDSLLLTLQSGNDLEQVMKKDFAVLDAQDLEARKKSLAQLYEGVRSP